MFPRLLVRPEKSKLSRCATWPATPFSEYLGDLDDVFDNQIVPADLNGR
jgi:hypothetical protein